MSILIKGMEMPEFAVTVTIWADGAVTHDMGLGYRQVVGWAVPVPPHGRLIDADVFEAHVQNEWENNEISNGDWIQFREWLRDEQTIIPAEPPKEEV